jgi:hypothetical protein
MAKITSRKTRPAGGEPVVGYDTRNFDPTKFRPDLSPNDWLEMFKPARRVPSAVFFQPIETLTPTKTVGKGRTNLTIIMSTIVQTDVLPPILPHASFNRQATPSRNPVIQMHFEPAAYGITTVGSYFMAFTIAVSKASTFELNGNFGVNLSGAGTKNLAPGQHIVTLVFKDVAPAMHLFGFLEQTSGGAWTWFSTRVSLPPLVISPGP